jgi:hypothetical protein
LADAQGASVAKLQRAASARAAGQILTARRLLALTSAHNLTVALDLKGGERQPERHAQQLEWLAQTITSTPGLAERVTLYVETTEAARALRRSLRLTAPSAAATLSLVKPVRDRGLRPAAAGAPLECASSQLQRADATLFSRLGRWAADRARRRSHSRLCAALTPRWVVGARSSCGRPVGQVRQRGAGGRPVGARALECGAQPARVGRRRAVGAADAAGLWRRTRHLQPATARARARALALRQQPRSRCARRGGGGAQLRGPRLAHVYRMKNELAVVQSAVRERDSHPPKTVE